MANPLKIALKGKGFVNLTKRFLSIGRRYGLTMGRMNRTLRRFAFILQEFDCQATFPLTASTLSRRNGKLIRYQDQGIEFAIHGYVHVDHLHLSPEQLVDHLDRAQRLFADRTLRCSGFRAPYLRWNQDTLDALVKLGFQYDSSQALWWDVVDPAQETEAYHRALEFYGARSAQQHLSVPRIEDGLVRIPYSLPDDEALVERLQFADARAMSEPWLRILRRTHELGELFTVGLHPERIAACEDPLRAVLKEARAMRPAVWIARLDEIGDWWRSRAETTYTVVKEGEDGFRLHVDGPPGTTVLSRSVLVEAPAEPWYGGYRRVFSTDLRFRSSKMPFIGVAPGSPASLVSFLHEQGYLVLGGSRARSCSCYLDRDRFQVHDERALLAQIEEGTWPLLRVARWPDGASSALSVTGDIDALTVWDYVLRVVGN